jgi:hypothetical protein
MNFCFGLLIQDATVKNAVWYADEIGVRHDKPPHRSGSGSFHVAIAGISPGPEP